MHVTGIEDFLEIGTMCYTYSINVSVERSEFV